MRRPIPRHAIRPIRHRGPFGAATVEVPLSAPRQSLRNRMPARSAFPPDTGRAARSRQGSGGAGRRGLPCEPCRDSGHPRWCRPLRRPALGATRRACLSAPPRAGEPAAPLAVGRRRRLSPLSPPARRPRMSPSMACTFGLGIARQSQATPSGSHGRRPSPGTGFLASRTNIRNIIGRWGERLFQPDRAEARGSARPLRHDFARRPLACLRAAESPIHRQRRTAERRARRRGPER